MNNPHPPTLEQLRVFLAIADAGSFAGAARQLNRATSVVSYQLANLEAQLNLSLFDRRTAKRVSLTEAGRALLPGARAVTREVGGLLTRTRSLLQGEEAEVSLAVDVMMPIPTLTEILNAFSAAYPTVTLRLHVEAVGAVTQLVRDGVADLGISGPVPTAAEGLEFVPLYSIAMVPVAAPNHPLSVETDSAVAALKARDYVQLVLSDRSKLSEGRDFGVLSEQTWRLADLGAKHALLLAGVGWGSMPEPMIKPDLEAGRLVRLPLNLWKDARYHLRAVYRSDKALGPAGRWLLDRVQRREIGD
ncbi:LysR family transcriptional regulator [Ensifer adhaerens]|uniref:LysR family transcriptional regulator n=1 Tax=Ensifer TaxID=106591 RepID=UPI0007162524|nr:MULTISPECIES: LysR family transcriptional regulator [unclassified Ensifer]KQX14454.1 LysR family transcriptional regulator [Ensifer sp. Root423]KQZ44437.1 LysR family transcriptional regulator [Ensifer sp. Root558]MBD9573372.1 LysR family transcriptional regulator [Ensifer sp. ENS08]